MELNTCTKKIEMQRKDLHKYIVPAVNDEHTANIQFFSA